MSARFLVIVGTTVEAIMKSKYVKTDMVKHSGIMQNEVYILNTEL